MAKTRQIFVKIAKFTVKSRHRHGIKSWARDHYAVYKTQHPALTTTLQ